MRYIALVSFSAASLFFAASAQADIIQTANSANGWKLFIAGPISIAEPSPAVPAPPPPPFKPPINIGTSAHSAMMAVSSPDVQIKVVKKYGATVEFGPLGGAYSSLYRWRGTANVTQRGDEISFFAAVYPPTLTVPPVPPQPTYYQVSGRIQQYNNGMYWQFFPYSQTQVSKAGN